MDPPALLELPKDSIPRVVAIAMNLGVEKKENVYGRLGGELTILRYSLEYPSPLCRRKIGTLLSEIEDVCTVSRWRVILLRLRVPFSLISFLTSGRINPCRG